MLATTQNGPDSIRLPCLPERFPGRIKQTQAKVVKSQIIDSQRQTFNDCTAYSFALCPLNIYTFSRCPAVAFFCAPGMDAYIVVDADLSKFFDRVNHDILIDRLKKRMSDTGVIRLVRAYLNAGIMDDRVVIEQHVGTP